MYKYNMFGPPCIRPPGSILLRQVWMYVIKNSRKNKSINFFYGSPLTVNCVQYAKNCAACAYQHGFNIFLALSAALGYIILVYGDINAYAWESPPEEPFYAHVYYQYIYWYHVKQGIYIPSGFVLPGNRSFLVHSHYGALWAHIIISLLSELGFKGTLLMNPSYIC